MTFDTCGGKTIIGGYKPNAATQFSKQFTLIPHDFLYFAFTTIIIDSWDGRCYDDDKIQVTLDGKTYTFSDIETYDLCNTKKVCDSTYVCGNPGFKDLGPL